MLAPNTRVKLLHIDGNTTGTIIGRTGTITDVTSVPTMMVLSFDDDPGEFTVRRILVFENEVEIIG